MATFTASIKINAVSNLAKVLKPVQKSIKAITKGAQRMAKAWKKNADQFKKFARAAKLMAAAATAAMIALIKSTANYGDNLAKTSQKVGISVKNLQKLRFSAQLGGASIRDMDTALKVFSRSIDEAAGGMAEYKEQFDRLGISVLDNNGKMKTSEALLLEVADVFTQLEDGAAKASLAQQLFGRSGLNMIPMLNQGSAAILAQGKELESLNLLMTEDQAKAAEQFNDDLLRLTTELKLMSVAIGTDLIPPMTDFINKTREALAPLREWIRTNDTLIPTLEAMWSILKGIGAVIELVIRGVQQLGTWIGAASGEVENFFRKLAPVLDRVQSIRGFFGDIGGRINETVEIVQSAFSPEPSELNIKMEIDDQGRKTFTIPAASVGINFDADVGIMLPQEAF